MGVPVASSRVWERKPKSEGLCFTGWVVTLFLGRVCPSPRTRTPRAPSSLRPRPPRHTSGGQETRTGPGSSGFPKFAVATVGLLRPFFRHGSRSRWRRPSILCFVGLSGEGSGRGVCFRPLLDTERVRKGVFRGVTSTETLRCPASLPTRGRNQTTNRYHDYLESARWKVCASTNLSAPSTERTSL